MTPGATSSPPVWRSLLYVPVNQRRFVDKAHTRGADAIQLDLEDSIAPAEKDDARTQLPDAVDRVAAHGVDVVVRINRPWRIAVRDVEVAVRPGVRALALPKIASADHVRMLDEVVTEVEAQAGMAAGSVGFIAMVETADALFKVREIAGAGPRVWALTLGSEDLATTLGIEPHPDLLSSHKMSLIAAARAAGVWPLGLVGTLADFKDVDGFRAIARHSRRAGCVGASAIHPVQVPILNEEFTPDPEAVARAQRLVSAYEDAHARGVGAIEFEGGMIDEPLAERARGLIRLHESIAR